MPITFKPKYTITNRMASMLLKLEALKERISGLPITPSVLAHLRETAKLFTTHYSTQIEGNRLSEKDVEKVLKLQEHFPGRERDEQEVKGYYKALESVEKLAVSHVNLTERTIQTIHAHVMNHNKPSPYRDGQNVIKDSRTGGIVYMPPEAKDVPELMREFIAWLDKSNEDVPCPIRAAVAHYQFATIHPYYDGNGRTARLLTTLILHSCGYGLKGIYSLEEYYAKDLQGYYDAISVGPSHNYYMGRAEADISRWVEYFILGMIDAFTKVAEQASRAKENAEPDQTELLRKLDPRQRKVLTLFKKQEIITSNDVATLFSFASRTARVLMAQWVEAGFLAIANPSKKARKYKLSKRFSGLF